MGLDMREHKYKESTNVSAGFGKRLFWEEKSMVVYGAWGQQNSPPTQFAIIYVNVLCHLEVIR